MKINFDFSFINSEINVGIVLIHRDYTGYCRGPRGISCPIETVDEGEALAAFETIRWAEELFMDKALIEGDSSNIIHFLNGAKEEKDMDWRSRTS